MMRERRTVYCIRLIIRRKWRENDRKEVDEFLKWYISVTRSVSIHTEQVIITYTILINVYGKTEDTHYN